jgi:hypothetical protein
MEERRNAQSFSKGIICPILKKEDRTLCNNYRGITLLNVTYKVFAILLLYNRLLEIVKNQLGDFQMGFRPGRSTIDNIHIVRQIFEKCYEYNINLHNLFIDFSQAFDEVNRDKLCEYLEYYQTPPKLIKLIKIALQDTTANVRINNEMTELIEIKYGVRQGDPLSTLLFSIVIDVIIKKLNPRGNISTQLMQTCEYAYDVLVISRT